MTPPPMGTVAGIRPSGAADPAAPSSPGAAPAVSGREAQW
jgi:hypothetical protein